MRILVMSDCHGAVMAVRKAINRHPDAVNVFYLGDGSDSVIELATEFPEKVFHIVSGNCDFGCRFSAVSVAELDGTRILFTHGHTLSANYGTQRLLEAGKKANAKIVLYGHTHVAKEEYKDGIYLVNPGAMRSPRDGKEGYAVIDITQAGILISLLKL